MKENMRDTIRVDAKNVNREVGEAFKSFVFKKHGKLRGAYSEEVTAALREYLQRRDHNKLGREIDIKILEVKTEKERLDTQLRLAKLEEAVFRPRDE